MPDCVQMHSTASCSECGAPVHAGPLYHKTWEGDRRSIVYKHRPLCAPLQQLALERQDLSCMYLAHHELENVVSIINNGQVNFDALLDRVDIGTEDEGRCRVLSLLLLLLLLLLLVLVLLLLVLLLLL